MNDLDSFKKSIHEIALELIGVPQGEGLKSLRELIKKLPEGNQRDIATELVLMTLASMQNPTNKTTIFNVKNNYGQIGEVLESCTNIINQQPGGELKDLLKKLGAEVDSLIAKLPNDKEKKIAADNLSLLVKSATDAEPKRPWYSVSAKGLLDASKFTKEFAGNIAGTIGQLGKLLWPDFKLEETEKN